MKSNLPLRVRVIFWLHFLVALSAHVLIPIMAAAVIGIIIGQDIGFLQSGLLIGLTFCAFIWAVNHVTNPNSYCWLTDLECFYRRQAGVNINGKAFLPRFYKKVNQILRRNFSDIPE